MRRQVVRVVSPGRGGAVTLPPDRRHPDGARPSPDGRPGGPSGRRAPPPIPISPRARTLLIGAALVALVLLVRAAPSVLIITLGGATLALLLSFPVRLLSRAMPRGLAIVTTFLALLFLIILALVQLVPLLIEQLTDLIAATPAIAEETDGLLRGLLRPLEERNLLPGDPDELINQFQDEAFNRAQTLAQTLLVRLLGVVSSTVTILLQFFGILFVAIYLLVDIRKIRAAYLWAAPKGYRRDADDLWRAFALTLSRYLGGLAFVVVIQGALATLALWALGVPYAVVLGAWISATAILPYIGAFLGAAPAIIVAAFVSPTTAVLTILAYLGIQQFEVNFLTPRIQ